MKAQNVILTKKTFSFEVTCGLGAQNVYLSSFEYSQIKESNLFKLGATMAKSLARQNKLLRDAKKYLVKGQHLAAKNCLDCWRYERAKYAAMIVIKDEKQAAKSQLMTLAA